MTQRIFVSSVQKEFAEERRAIRDFVQGDALLSRFFSVFLFEDLPASDRRANDIYLSEVDRCDLYVGVLGNEYGLEDDAGISPTEREFDRATERGKTRLVFVKGADDAGRHPKMQALVAKAGAQLVRRRFVTTRELIGGLYAALVQSLEDRELIRTGPFDATPCSKGTLADLDEERMSTFLRRARRARGFPLPEEATSSELLTHLNLLDQGRPTNAAVLLFGKQPQRFLIASEVKCAHFHGNEVAKPIPSYQVYKGTVFDLVDQAVDFVMSKINLWVGTRKDGLQVPVAYEIPIDVVREAIVNAVAHRDYTSNGSVQVMLFADRLEIWNPGSLPPSLTLEMLRLPHGSVPGNPLLAESLYLAKYIERMGTGTRDMIRRCVDVGLPEPEFSVADGFRISLRRPAGQDAGPVRPQPESATGSATQSPTQSTDPVERLLSVLGHGELSAGELRSALEIKHRPTFRANYLHPALADGLIEYTLPDKPHSRLQKYRLTAAGRARLDEKPTGNGS